MLTGQIGLRRHSTGWVGKAIEWATRSHTHHVIVAVSEDVCMSAEPGGARYRLISDYPSVDWSRFGLTTEQRDRIRDAAADYEHAPYNYAIYPPLLWERLTGRKVPRLVGPLAGTAPERELLAALRRHLHPRRVPPVPGHPRTCHARGLRTLLHQPRLALTTHNRPGRTP